MEVLDECGDRDRLASGFQGRLSRIVGFQLPSSILADDVLDLQAQSSFQFSPQQGYLALKFLECDVAGVAEDDPVAVMDGVRSTRHGIPSGAQRELFLGIVWVWGRHLFWWRVGRHAVW